MSSIRSATHLKRSARSSLEPLEARIAPATFTVTTAADSGPGSLRQAILDANATPDTDDILFSIGTSVYATINVLTPLPDIVHPVHIDGSSQPGASTDWPQIVLLGDKSLPVTANGLTFNGVDSGGSQILGLSFASFSGSALSFINSSNNTVSASTFGNSHSGYVETHGSAISIVGGNHNILGGALPGDGLKISGMSYTAHIAAIQIAGGSDNQILGSRIFGNYGDGIQILGKIAGQLTKSTGNVIGLPGAGNLISANTDRGISVSDSTGTVIQGNIIGLADDGISTLSNDQIGISLSSLANDAAPAGTKIGGTAPGEGNVISGNRSGGIDISGPTPQGVLIQGNLIGTDKNGDFHVAAPRPGYPDSTGNGGYGIIASSVTNLTLGGTTSGARNVIAGNGSDGDYGVTYQYLFGGVVLSNCTAAVVQGNLIGTDATGTKAAGNLNDGIRVSGGQVTIGGNTPGARNVISANGTAVDASFADFCSGILLLGDPVAKISGNYIGTDITGTVALGNQLDGIHISSVGLTGSQTLHAVTIGGSTSAEGNLISGNGSAGIEAGATPESSLYASTTVSGLQIADNLIGTDATGAHALGNRTGIVLNRNTSNDKIGFTQNGNLQVYAPNIISGNTSYGISADGFNHIIKNNFIGVDATGVSALGNGNSGLFTMPSSRGFQIQSNIISANGFLPVGSSGPGVLLEGSSHLLLSNNIGLNLEKTAALGNAGAGLSILTNSGDATIGTAQSGNFIAGNGGNGITLNAGTDSGGFVIRGNQIGMAGNRSFPNGGDGISVTATGGKGVSISSNQIANNAGDGIALSAPAGAQAANDEISSNQIFGNDGYGLVLDGVNSTFATAIDDNTIGFSNLGVGAANGKGGILVSHSVAIIGEKSSDGNFIAGNNGPGISIEDCPAGLFIGGCTIGAEGIVTPPGGVQTVVDLGNTGPGIWIRNTPGITIGGPSYVDQGNVISWNHGPGIVIDGASPGTLITGNRVGTDYEGIVQTDAPASGNAGAGILLRDSNGVTIGGVTQDASNYVGGNGFKASAGFPEGRGGVVLVNTSESTILGNYLGLGAKNDPHSGNYGAGILIDGGARILINNDAAGNVIDGSTRNVIGGSADGARNFISGNQGDGIRITGTVSVTIAGNFIGTDGLGTAAVPNTGDGIHTGVDGYVFLPPVEAVMIGGSEAADGNLISGNGGNGIEVGGSSILGDHLEDAVQIGNNKVGTDVTGTVALGNGADGVHLGDESGAARIGRLLVNGAEVSARNIISANTGVGLSASGLNHLIADNYIGVDVTGSAALGNGSAGLLTGADLQGGGGLDVLDNVISANGFGSAAHPAPGVSMVGLAAHLAGNIIGLDATRTIALGNAGAGISITAEFGLNEIGGNGDGNTIAGNGGDGIAINNPVGFHPISVDIADNEIGVAGTLTFPNGGHGIHVLASYEDQGEVEIRDNSIENNVGAGVALELAGHATISNNRFLNNGGLAIDLDADGPTPNDSNDSDGGANSLQNNITFRSAALQPASTTGGGATLLRGAFNGAPNRDLQIEFFHYGQDAAGHETDGMLYDTETIHTDAAGHANISFDQMPVNPGDRLGGTVTDLATGDTSEFSSITVVKPPAVFAVGTTHGTIGTAGLVSVDAHGTSTLLSLTPYGSAFRGGVNVTHADVDHDGYDDLITAPQAGKQPVRIFSGFDGALLASWAAAPPRFTGGVTVAAGDTDGDGTPEIITALGQGGPPRVTVHDALSGATRTSFLAFAAATRTGVNLVAGDLDGNGLADIVASTATGRAAVRMFSPDGHLEGPVIHPFANAFSFGAHVALLDSGNSPIPYLAIGSGAGVRSAVSFYSPQGLMAFPPIRVSIPGSTSPVSLASVTYSEFSFPEHEALITATTTSTVLEVRADGFATPVSFHPFTFATKGFNLG